jgi:hypothetical protein
MRQEVLIISDDSQHRESRRLLPKSVGCESVCASSLEEGMRILNSRPAAASALDSGIASWGSHQKSDKIQDIVKYLAGRVILVFGETPDPEVMELAP